MTPFVQPASNIPNWQGILVLFAINKTNFDSADQVRNVEQ
jgi:hypothetical protein